MIYSISDEKELVVASHNSGKVKEIESLLSSYGVSTIPAMKLNLPEPEENGASFYENAKIKAVSASSLSGLVSLADDSGLCINALDGQPGIHSARWAGPEKDFNIAIERVKMELENKSDKSAYFVCGLALGWPDGHIEYFEGRIDGIIQFPPRGKMGFGYDPIFCPLDSQLTFAEIPHSKKIQINHRMIAFEKLVKKHLSLL